MTLRVPVEFSVLGDLRARRGGDELDLGSPQQRGVLALLLLRAGRLVSAEDLVDRMWGVNPPRSARVTLRTYVSRLRRSLDDPRLAKSVIESTPGGYRLPITSETLDLAVFEARVDQARITRSAGDTAGASVLLHAALSLWRGYPLAGVGGQFVDQERDRLDQFRLAVLEERIALDLELGRGEDLVSELTGLVNAHPFRERLLELLMLALYRASRQADALHEYQRIRALLSQELGIEPGPGLRALHQQILQSAAELLAPVPHTHTVSTPRFPVPSQVPAGLHGFIGGEAQIPEHSFIFRRADRREGRVRYARNGNVRLAYRVWGEADTTLVWVPGWVSHVDSHGYPTSVYGNLSERLAQKTRLVLWDKRGTGLSDPVSHVPSLDERMDDLRAVMDATEVDCPALLGISEGGPMSLLFAATYPERVQSLVLLGTAARFSKELPDFPWGFTPAQIDEQLLEIDTRWGEGALTELFFGAAADVPNVRELVGREQRLAASPTTARLLWQSAMEIDVRGALPAVRTPTLVLARRGDRIAPLDAAAALADGIPNAEFRALPPGEHYAGDIADVVASEIVRFVCESPSHATGD
jgi:DNA-binding SARP family transcriptional activator/pimeloyl-ACP methyl ester carboxylesterase